jgi:hypothetical protein
MTQFIEPPFNQWSKIANNSIDMSIASSHHDTSHTLREILIELGRNYTTELLSIAAERGIKLPCPSLVDGAAERIIMSGHQPVVYHPGLLLKEVKLELFAKENNFLPIHVTIDTDEGDGGALLYPEVSPVSVTKNEGVPFFTAPNYPKAYKRSFSIATTTGLYLNQKVGEPEVVREAIRRLEEALSRLGMVEQLSVITQVKELYEKLSGVSIAVANSLVRWYLRGRKHLEVPFSRLLKAPAVQNILLQWIQGGREFALSYNQVLDSFRAERKIKNSANPFPNMVLREGSAEVPFWIIDSKEGVRTPCIAPFEPSPLEASTSFVAPRGSITTLLLRGFCSDIFIHGKGGAKYDPFVDRLAESVVKVRLAPFVVASQDLRLFPKQYAEHLSAEELKVQYKEIVSHTEKYLVSGLFSEEESQNLRRAVEERREALKNLQLASEASARSAAAHRLNAVNRAVKQILDTSSIQEKLRILDSEPEVVAAWACREYPFFLYSDSYQS